MKFFHASLLTLLSMAANHATYAQECIEAYQKAVGAVTVYPYADQLAIDYRTNCSQYNLTVEAGGSTVGAKRVCGDTTLGPVDIGNMSRDWKTTEATKQSDGYTFNCSIGNTTRQVAQLAVANDAVVLIVKADPITPAAVPTSAPLALFSKRVSVSAQGSALTTAGCIQKLGCLSKDILRWIYSNYTVSQLLANGWTNVIPNSDNNDTTHLWSELDSACSNTEIKITGSDSAAGDTDFFKTAILTGPFEGIRSGYVGNVNKSNTNDYVVANVGAIGFSDFGTAFSTTPATTVAVPIKNPAGTCVTPSATTVADGTYNPLSRQTFMNVLKNNCTGLKAALGYIQYAVSTTGQNTIVSKGGIKLNSTQVTATTNKVNTLLTCT